MRGQPPGSVPDYAPIFVFGAGVPSCVFQHVDGQLASTTPVATATDERKPPPRRSFTPFAPGPATSSAVPGGTTTSIAPTGWLPTVRPRQTDQDRRSPHTMAHWDHLLLPATPTTPVEGSKSPLFHL